MMVSNGRLKWRSQLTRRCRNSFTRRLAKSLVLASLLLLADRLPRAYAQAADQPIYSDTLVNGWQDWGWGPHNYANTAPIHTGTTSVSFAPNAWQGLYVHHSAIDTSPYANVSFWVHGGSSGGQQFLIQAVVNGNPQPAVLLNPFPANQWQQVTIPLASLGAANASAFEGFWIQDATGSTQATVYLDDIVLQSNRPIPPTNLRIKGLWNGGSTDVLTWDPVPGATAYTLYRYGQPFSVGLSGTTFTLSTTDWIWGLTYSVTALANGQESVPSNIVTAQGAWNPAVPPTSYPPSPTIPNSDPNRPALKVVPEWNKGVPRVAVKWEGFGEQFFNVYRDGIKIAEGLWGLNYIDTQVAQGQSHSYAVSSVNVSWTTEVESALCTAVTVTIPPPPSGSVGVMTTPTYVSNDDSVLVSFSAVTGAVDYRAYIVDPLDPTHKHFKYSGGSLSIEMNGINTVNGADIVVEAVDKLGPFSPMDDTTPHPWMIVNGQGDPSNVPEVLSRSASFHVTCTSAVLTGSQAFFDTFRGPQTFVQASTMDSAIVAANGGNPNNAANPDVREYQSNNWVIRNYLGDMTNTKIFVMADHFMDIFHDGGTPGTNTPLHVGYSSLVMLPKATADISGGKVLHATFEVDPHMGDRRWCDVFVADASDPLIHPGNFADTNANDQLPTVSGNMFRWEIKREFHEAQVFKGVNGTRYKYPLIDLSDWNERSGPPARLVWNGDPLPNGNGNGTAQYLDKRHKFDLYLSQTRMQIYEQGQLIKDATFPTGATLPFTQAAVYFVHQLYHSDLDRKELLAYKKDDSYWYNYRPWMDERHWDNMGFEVVNAFP